MRKYFILWIPATNTAYADRDACYLPVWHVSGEHIILVVGLVDRGQQAQGRAALQALLTHGMLKSSGCLACSAGVTVLVHRAAAAPRAAGKPENGSQRVILPNSVINKHKTMNEEKKNPGSSGEEQKKNNSSLLLFCILTLQGREKSEICDALLGSWSLNECPWKLKRARWHTAKQFWAGWRKELRHRMENLYRIEYKKSLKKLLRVYIQTWFKRCPEVKLKKKYQ